MVLRGVHREDVGVMAYEPAGSDAATKDYRITVKVRNNRILKAIEDAGGTPGKKWCDANGICYPVVNNLINMTVGPLSASGSISSTALKLCEALNKLPEDLWSNEQLYPLEKNFSEIEMDYEQVVALLPSDEQYYLPDFSDFENRQAENLIGKALAKLSGKGREVLRMRYEEDMTLDQCAERLGVSRERIRQIEAKALRQMRHPAIVGIYADVLDGDARDKYDRSKKMRGG